MRPVYTLSELTPDELASLPKPARLAVIGNPIAHSRSPQMQQAALDNMLLPVSYIRVQSGLEEGAFERTVNHLGRLGFIGVNVTVPFKKRALAMAQKADTLATLCGAANTLQFTRTGIIAVNTDGPGFEKAIMELCDRPLSSMRVLILGACGGAGSALAAQCALSGCPLLTLANRPRPELEQMVATLASHANIMCMGINCVSMADEVQLADAVADSELIVNATSLGLKEGDPMPLNPAWLRPGQVVYDIVPHDTPLRREAAARSCIASNGLSMLLWQGAYAFKQWFTLWPSVNHMSAALEAAH